MTTIKTYKLKDGKTRYEIYFYATDILGNKKRYHRRGFTLRRLAIEYMESIKKEIAQQNPEYVKGLCHAYLKDGETRLKPTTYKNRIYFINAVVLPKFGDYRISDITPLVIRNWENELIDCGYSDTYLRCMQARMSALFNYAVRYYHLAQNPVPLAGPIGKSHRDTFDFWTKDEFDIFIKKLLEESKFTHDHIHRKLDDFIYYVAFMVLFYSGMRSGEMLALTVSDVNTETDMVTINKNYAVVEGNELILTPKTPKSNRIIKLPKKVIMLLQDLTSRLVDPNSDTRFFEGLNKHSLAQALHTTADKAGLKQIRVHDLRHSHASMLVYNNVPFMDIRDRLGHENMKTTLDLYSHLYPERRDAIGDTLNRLLDEEI